MTPEFDIIENPPSNSHLWKQWKDLVDTEGWTSDDNSVTLLIPTLKTTRSVFAVTKTPEQNYIGSVTWNEYDDICWLGFFLLYPEYRGKGIGSKIWKIAMERYNKNLTLSLRGVVAMAPKYKANDTPVDGPILENYRMKSSDFYKTFHQVQHNSQDLDRLTPKLVRSLSSEDWQKFLRYDLEVTGRDRQEFLQLYYKSLDFTDGFAFFNENGEIEGVVSAVPSSHREDNIIKVSPLFANSQEIAFFAMRTLSKRLLEKYPTATVVVHTVNLPNGSFNVFRKFFEEDVKLQAGCSGITLFSGEYPAKGNLGKVFIPHNNSCHYDY